MHVTDRCATIDVGAEKIGGIERHRHGIKQHLPGGRILPIVAEQVPDHSVGDVQAPRGKWSEVVHRDQQVPSQGRGWRELEQLRAEFVAAGQLQGQGDGGSLRMVMPLQESERQCEVLVDLAGCGDLHHLLLEIREPEQLREFRPSAGVRIEAAGAFVAVIQLEHSDHLGQFTGQPAGGVDPSLRRGADGLRYLDELLPHGSPSRTEEFSHGSARCGGRWTTASAPRAPGPRPGAVDRTERSCAVLSKLMRGVDGVETRAG